MRNAFVVSLLSAALCGGVQAQTVPPQLITVTGEATVERTPDLVAFSMGVVAKGASIESARSAAAVKMAVALKALARAGVQRSEIETSDFSVTRVWDPTVGPMQRGHHVGGVRYRVSNTLIVKTARVTGAGKIVDAALGAGLNDVYGPSYQLKDDAAARSEALVAAYLDAEKKAHALVDAAGRHIGVTYRITERGATEPDYGDLGASGMSFGVAYMSVYRRPAFATALVSGKVTVRASVSVSFSMS